MKIRYIESDRYYNLGKPIVSNLSEILSDALKKHGIEDQTESLRKFLGNLVELLVDKQLLSVKEVESCLNYDSQFPYNYEEVPK
jgi:hypothetical protein